MSAKKVSLYGRAEEFKDEGLYISDTKSKIMMCKYYNCIISWEKRSTIINHCKSKSHIGKKEKHFSLNNNIQRQVSLTDSLDKLKKDENVKHNLNISIVEAFLKSNIPLEKLDHPALREWINENVKGGGSIASAKWQREKYLPEVKEKYDQMIIELLKGKQIVVLCDETTNRKGEAVFQILFRILPTEKKVEPFNVVAAVNVLPSCTGDSCSKAIIQALNKYEVNYENVIAISTDSVPYMNLCVRLLKELVNPSLEHIQCWDHKLDKICKIYSNKLTRLNECVKKTKKLFKNTRKRKNMYIKYLKDKYSFTKEKVPKLFPLPVITRWSSWKNSVVYLSEYLEDVSSYAKTLSDDVESVNYFKGLSVEDISIIKAEATFVKDYCVPVDNLLLLLEGSKYPTAHRLYAEIGELCAYFNVVKTTQDIKSVLATETKKYFDKIHSATRRKNLEQRFKSIATDCYEQLKTFVANDQGKILFGACEALFAPTKIAVLKSKEASDVTKYITKYKNNLYVLREIPTSNFIVLHSLLRDAVYEKFRNQPTKSKDYCLVEDVLLSMREKHPEFCKSCLQALYLPTSNTDVERGFSAYNDVVSHRRCRLLEGNAELMFSLYFCDPLSDVN